ncbi:MAG TPA: hypothetical protein VHT91_06680 [Kofleriaceae bacterium]|jgi:predicted nucleic acid-binding protein|nr:hypothetical protein [Kofleriaceae bacterium]
MATLLASFAHKPDTLFYLDTSAVFPLALQAAGTQNQLELDRARRVSAFLDHAKRNSSRGLCSVLVLEEIAAHIRNKTQRDALTRVRCDKWRDFCDTDPDNAEAEGKKIQATVLKMLTHTADALASAGITVEQPVVINAAEAGKKLRKAHRDFLRHYHAIDSMDALHMALGSTLGCKHFITFDKHWTSVTEIEVLYN